MPAALGQRPRIPLRRCDFSSARTGRAAPAWDQSGAIDDQESADPTGRDPSQPCKLIRVRVGRPSGSPLLDEFEHRFRGGEQQRPSQHVGEARLHGWEKYQLTRISKTAQPTTRTNP